MRTDDTCSSSPTPGSSPCQGPGPLQGQWALGRWGRSRLGSTGWQAGYCQAVTCPPNPTVDRDAFLPQERSGTASKGGGSPQGQQARAPGRAWVPSTCSRMGSFICPLSQSRKSELESVLQGHIVPACGDWKMQSDVSQLRSAGSSYPEDRPAGPLHGGGFCMSEEPRL